MFNYFFRNLFQKQSAHATGDQPHMVVMRTSTQLPNEIRARTFFGSPPSGPHQGTFGMAVGTILHGVTLFYHLASPPP